MNTTDRTTHEQTRKAREWAAKGGLSTATVLWNHNYARDVIATVIETLDPEGPYGANEQNVAAAILNLRLLLLMQAPPEDAPGLFPEPGPHLESVENPTQE